ncbi:unnamed protein product, partial [Mesorhabditis spiculigera]
MDTRIDDGTARKLHSVFEIGTRDLGVIKPEADRAGNGGVNAEVSTPSSPPGRDEQSTAVGSTMVGKTARTSATGRPHPGQGQLRGLVDVIPASPMQQVACSPRENGTREPLRGGGGPSRGHDRPALFLEISVSQGKERLGRGQWSTSSRPALCVKSRVLVTWCARTTSRGGGPSRRYDRLAVFWGLYTSRRSQMAQGRKKTSRRLVMREKMLIATKALIGWTVMSVVSYLFGAALEHVVEVTGLSNWILYAAISGFVVLAAAFVISVIVYGIVRAMNRQDNEIAVRYTVQGEMLNMALQRCDGRRCPNPLAGGRLICQRCETQFHPLCMDSKKIQDAVYCIQCQQWYYVTYGREM